MRLLSSDKIMPGDEMTIELDVKLAIDEVGIHKYKTVVVKAGEYYTLVDVFEGRKGDD